MYYVFMCFVCGGQSQAGAVHFDFWNKSLSGLDHSEQASLARKLWESDCLYSPALGWQA